MRRAALAVGCLASFLAAASLGAAGSESSLVQAVKSSDHAAVRALLQRRGDVNVPESDGTTALHWAAHLDDLETTALLIGAGANVNALNRYGVSPLLVACENGNAGIIDRLLKAGADPNSAMGEGETALMTAARAGKPDAVRLLLTRGADVNRKERWRGQTALMFAAVANNDAAAKALIDAGASIDARSAGGFTPLLFAARGGHQAVAGVLLSAGANVNDTLPDGMTALVLSVVNAHYEFGAFLLDKGADPNADRQGWTALHQLVWTRRPNMGQIPMQAPVTTGTLDSLDFARRLLAHGANPNARQQKDPKDGYRNLLNRVGATPLLLAAKAADADLMRLLVEQGADPLLTNADHVTVLMAAAGVGIWAVGESPGSNEEALEAVKVALDVGGDVNAVSDHGYTALFGAVHRGANDIIQLLVDKGAKLDVKLTKTGGGPLGWREGWTPLDIAEGVFYANTFKRQPETATLLRRLMAERGLTPTPPTTTASAPQ